MVLAPMKSGAQFRWRDGRPVAILFALTILLPALTLALLAYRALDSDRQLAEQAARERLADAGLQGYKRVEGCVQEVRSRTEALGRFARGFDESLPLDFYSPYGCSKGEIGRAHV